MMRCIGIKKHLKNVRQCEKKTAVTLIEMIVVMALIAMITSAVAYNYPGSLEKGRAFKTQELCSKVRLF